MTQVLFLCTHNQLRSPTAEQVFSTSPHLTVTSAGIHRDAATVVTSELIDWSDHIFAMEETHRIALSKRFGSSLNNTRIHVLDIPDHYDYLAQELVELLIHKVCRILDIPHPTPLVNSGA